MKKYAMVMLNENFDYNQLQLNTGDVEHYIVPVRTILEAFEKVVELADSGFGAIEVCGAFGEEIAKQLYEAIDRKVPIGYVIYPEEQKEQLSAFWESK